jgi:hypothetical protein
LRGLDVACWARVLLLVFVWHLSRNGVYLLLYVLQVEGEELEVLRGLDAACWARVQQIAVWHLSRNDSYYMYSCVLLRWRGRSWKY